MVGVKKYGLNSSYAITSQPLTILLLHFSKGNAPADDIPQDDPSGET